MPKAGKYTYPTRDIDDCLNILQQVYQKTKESTLSRDAFAEALGFSPKSSWTGIVLGSLSQYGLVDTIDGNVVFTELGKEIIHGTDEEKSNAIQNAVRKVQLFDEFGDKYGLTFTDDNLRHFLREKAGVDIAEIATVSVEVGKLLKKVLPHITSMSNTTIEPKQESLPQNNSNNEKKYSIPYAISNPDMESYSITDDFMVMVKRDPNAIDFCLEQIESIKSWLKYVKEKKCVPVTSVIK
jgi:hypothetical protein